MTPTWHTGHKAARHRFWLRNRLPLDACVRCSSRVLDVAFRALARCCPRCREHAVSSRHRRAFERIVPRCRADARPPTGDRAPVPPRFLPPRAVRFNLRPPFLAKNVDLWQSAPAPRERHDLISPLVGSEARILPVSCPIITRMARESLPSCPSFHLPSPEIDNFSENRAPQDTNRCSSVQTGAGSVQMEPRAQRTGIPSRHTGGKPIPARNPLSSASCRARYPAT